MKPADRLRGVFNRVLAHVHGKEDFGAFVSIPRNGDRDLDMIAAEAIAALDAAEAALEALTRGLNDEVDMSAMMLAEEVRAGRKALARIRGEATDG